MQLESMVTESTIVVTAVAANTALGGLPQAAAAAQAGMCRPAALEEVVFDDEGMPAPVMGHPVLTVAGFRRDARLFGLAFPSLLELAPAGRDLREEVGFYLALRPPYPDDGASNTSPQQSSLIDRLLEAAGMTSPSHLKQTFRIGHAGFIHAVLAALRTLREGRAQSCIVGGVDSQIDDEALTELLAQRRVACGARAVGLHPGEASVFLRLERSESARNRYEDHTRLIEIAAVMTANDPLSWDHPPRGDGMFAAVAGCAAAIRPGSASRYWFVTDNTGEEWRAFDWSSCQMKFNQAHRNLLNAPVWHPAASFGDTGAASAPVAAMTAIHAFARRSAPGDIALVVSASDGGERGTIAFARPS